MYVIVVVHDGPMRIEVFGNGHNQPFTTQAEAEKAARTFPVHGAAYSTYVVPVGRI